MPFHSLILGRDPAIAQCLTRGLKELSVEVESCSELEHALQRLGEHRFEAVVINDEDHTGTTLILENLSALKSCKNSLRIVLIDPQTTLAAAFRTGTHLVIYKPLAPDRLRSSLRALHNLIGRRIRREFDRVRVAVPAIVQLAENKQVSASITEIGPGGLALATRQVPSNLKSLGLKFVLPGRAGMIVASAEVVWSDVRGRVGAQFVNMESTTHAVLSQWVSNQLLSARLQKRKTARIQQ